MKFRIIDLSGGFQKDCSFQDLSISLYSNCVILTFKEEGFESIGLVTHHTLVFFTVEFVSYALQNYTKKILPEAQTCIDLTRKWLEDQSSVSNEELRTAAEAADYAAYVAADYAAYVAADAADYAAYVAADYAAYVAADAADAAYAAAHAAHAARSAAHATTHADVAADRAAHAAGKNKLIEQNRQATFILNFFGAE
jgi:hypothetical protein